jgi:hypothetical protein
VIPEEVFFLCSFLYLLDWLIFFFSEKTQHAQGMLAEVTATVAGDYDRRDSSPAEDDSFGDFLDDLVEVAIQQGEVSMATSGTGKHCPAFLQYFNDFIFLLFSCIRHIVFSSSEKRL